MKTLWNIISGFFASTGTKIVSAQTGADLTAEQVQQLESSQELADFVAKFTDERITALSAQVNAQGVAEQKQAKQYAEFAKATNEKLAAMQATIEQLQSTLELAAQSAIAANAQADAVTAALNKQRSAPLVAPAADSAANDMLKAGTHAQQKNENGMFVVTGAEKWTQQDVQAVNAKMQAQLALLRKGNPA